MTSRKKTLDISKIPQIRIRLGLVISYRKIDKKKSDHIDNWKDIQQINLREKNKISADPDLTDKKSANK